MENAKLDHGQQEIANQRELPGKANHGAQGIPTAGAFWLANVLAAVLFGLGHLPAIAALMPLAGLVITRGGIL